MLTKMLLILLEHPAQITIPRNMVIALQLPMGSL